MDEIEQLHRVCKIIKIGPIDDYLTITQSWENIIAQSWENYYTEFYNYTELGK